MIQGRVSTHGRGGGGGRASLIEEDHASPDCPRYDRIIASLTIDHRKQVSQHISAQPSETERTIHNNLLRRTDVQHRREMHEQLLPTLSLPLMHLREMRTEVLRHVLVPVWSFAVGCDVFLHDDPRLQLLFQQVGLFSRVNKQRVQSVSTLTSRQ